MKNRSIIKDQQLVRIQHVTAIFLVIASTGVVLQIIGGHPYPPIPPVFFILLVPAAMLAFGRWLWASFVCLAAAAFLTLGLFASGSYHRLFNAPNAMDSLGLWIQLIAVLLVIPFSIVTVAKRKKRDVK